MPKGYRKQTVSGTSFQRCRSIMADNEDGSQPKLIFSEERVTEMSDGTKMREPVAQFPPLILAMEPGQTFPLLDPATGLQTGQTVSHEQVYAILFSAYMHAATERDAALATAEQPAP